MTRGGRAETPTSGASTGLRHGVVDRLVGRAARALGIALALAACNAHGARDAEQTLTIAGSSALLPLIQEGARQYMQTHPHVTIVVTAGGSRQGLSQVAAGTVTLGASDVFAPRDLASQLEDHRISVVGFATVAHRAAFNHAVVSLSREQLRGVFGGRVRDWSELGGMPQALTVINRPRNSGTRQVFGSLVLGGDGFVDGAAEQDNSGQLETMLSEEPGTLSYLALSYLAEPLRAFAYEGVEPTSENIASGRYPLWSYGHLYSRGAASGEVRAFLDYLASPSFQRDVVPRLHFVPIAAMRVSRDHD